MLYINNPAAKDSDIELFRRRYKKTSLNALSNPGLIRHFEPSLICSPNTESRSSRFLIDLVLKAAALSQDSTIENIDETKPDAEFFNIYPGEHYRLLKALTKILSPANVIEIGTSTGMSSKAILQGLDFGKLITFDLLPWDHFNTHLNESIFKDNFEQILIDLSIEKNFNTYKPLLDAADYIFIDGPKDSSFEYKFIQLLAKLQKKKNKLLIFDDIRFVNMIDLWVSIKSPKLDCTSFGHWSGTGLVDISNGFIL